MTKQRPHGRFNFAPALSRKEAVMKKLSSMKMVCIAIAFRAATAITSAAQTFSNLASFDSNTSGHSPKGVVQGTDGNFYGTTTFGGNGFRSVGTVFKVTPTGTLTAIHQFYCSNTDCRHGGEPMEPLLLGADGHVYCI